MSQKAIIDEIFEKWVKMCQPTVSLSYKWAIWHLKRTMNPFFFFRFPMITTWWLLSSMAQVGSFCVLLAPGIWKVCITFFHGLLLTVVSKSYWFSLILYWPTDCWECYTCMTAYSNIQCNLRSNDQNRIKLNFFHLHVITIHSEIIKFLIAWHKIIYIYFKK